MNQLKEFFVITAKHYNVYLLCYVAIIKYYKNIK